MRTNNRILKIVKVDYPWITFITNSGEYRDLNFMDHFRKLGIKEGDFGYEILTDKDLFNRVKLIDNAFAWEEVTKDVALPGEKVFTAFLHLDPVLCIKNSGINENYTTLLNLGNRIRSLRKHMKLSQEELGNRIGSTKQYISKIENNRTDLELKTLRKVFEIGLSKNIFIGYYDHDDKLRSFTNSILRSNFIEWANNHRDELLMIEGIGPKTKEWFEKENIMSPEELSEMKITYLFRLLAGKKSISFFHYPESWPLQARYMIDSDWINLIKLQRCLNRDHSSNMSKIENWARRALKQEIFW